MSEYHFGVTYRRTTARSEYHFGVTYKRTTAREDKIRQAAAEKHGAEWNSVSMHDGWRGWFSCKNRGHPFDGQIERQVLAELGIEV